MTEPIRLDRSVSFVDAVFGVIEGTGPIEAAASVLAAAERRHGLTLVWDGELVLDRGPFDEWCESSLFPFLNETHFVIAGGDLFQNCEIRTPDGLAVGFTWRLWGEVLADWANRHWVRRPVGLGQTRWSRKDRVWEYMDFYMDAYIDYQIDRYGEWAAVVLKVIELKCRSTS